MQHAIGRDFVNMWVGGRLVLAGKAQTLFDLHAYIDALHQLFHPALPPHFWSYPPSTFHMAAPLAMLPYGGALAVWTLLGLVAVFAAAGIGVTAEARARIFLLLAIAPATLVNVICGQNGFMTAALMAGGVLLLERRPVLAGVLIGLLTYKPHFGIVLAPALLVLGAWRTIAAASATAVGMVLLSMLLFGVEPWKAFVFTTLPNQSRMLAGFEGFFTSMLVSPYAMLRMLGLAHGAAMTVQVAISVVAICLAALGVRQTADGDRRLAMVAVATFLASPYTLTYDLPVIALVTARVAVRDDGEFAWSSSLGAAFAAAWLLPLASPMLAAGGFPFAQIVFFCLFAALVLDGRAASALPHPGRGGL